MSINQVIIDIILFAISSLAGWAIKAYVVPFIKEKNLEQIASVVVKAAEALFGAGNGQKKLQYCLDQIENKYNIDIDTDIVTNAIESAWQELDLDQINAGVKEVTKQAATEQE